MPGQSAAWDGGWTAFRGPPTNESEQHVTMSQFRPPDPSITPRSVREQLTALLALDDQADEQMTRRQRCYVAGTLAGPEMGRNVRLGQNEVYADDSRDGPPAASSNSGAISTRLRGI